jgi:2-oxo-4-hydroxy-4-carboxy--5-ureidoimidazoline (OHCU) decarboxylase
MALGRAFRAADPRNQARLKDAFPELFTEYARLAQLRAERQRQQDASA